MLIKNGLVFTEECAFEPLKILTDEGRITAILPESAMIKYSGEVFDADGCYIIPGLCDVHFHGCVGHDVCEGTETAFSEIAAFERSHGVTAVCPAVMTSPDDKLEQILHTAASFSKKRHADCAELVGLHLEGPFLSMAKKGAQNGAFIQPPNAEKLEKWLGVSEGLVKLVTVAPEISGSLDLIRKLSGRVHFSLGHTESGYETAMRAFEAGADHITHMFNAMPPFLHRDTGVIGAAFDSGNVFAELICDGVHLSGTAVRAAFRLFGSERIVLISDSMEAAGMPDGSYTLGGQSVRVSGERAELSDGTLAGSVTPLFDCMLKAVSFGIPLEDAVRAAAVNPCRSIGIFDEYGSIAVGKRAALLALERDTLRLRRVIS